MADWLTDFGAALQAGDFEQAMATYDAQANDFTNAPKAADKEAALKLAVKMLTAAERWRMAEFAATREMGGGRSLAAMLAANVYANYPQQATALLTTLVGDDDWEVREWAGSAAGGVLDKHFDAFYPTLQAWTRAESVNVRRAVCIALMKAANKRKPERAEPLLALLDPLIDDRAEYIRKNLGPFAIGASLLHAYPEATVARLQRWHAQEDSEARRWNIAMTFSASWARQHLEAGLALLTDPAADPRRFVWRATVLPLRNLAKADHAGVLATVRGWADDPQRAQVAAVALPYLERD